VLGTALNDDEVPYLTRRRLKLRKPNNAGANNHSAAGIGTADTGEVLK